jgi:hypothetical protein
MKNVQLTQQEVDELFYMVYSKLKECKEGSPQQNAYHKLAQKFWTEHSINK